MPIKDIERIAAETGFSGVVSIDRAGEVEFAKAYGLANRAYQMPNTLDTRFGTASGSKSSPPWPCSRWSARENWT